MSTNPEPEKQKMTDSSACGRRQDIAYRVGLIMQVLGTALLAVLYPLGNPFYSIGIMLFESGVLLSAVFFFYEKLWAKKTLLVTVLAGIVLQVYGLYAPEEYAGSIIIGGIGIVCAGAAGMAGKEAYCFKYREGWLLMLFGFPVMVLVNLLGKENRLFNSIGFSLVFLLLLSLTGKKLKQSLLPPQNKH